jgi:hypothetical protein
MTDVGKYLPPLAAYERAERQKHSVGQAFRGKIIRLRQMLSERGIAASRIPPWLPQPLRAGWRDAARAFLAGDDPLAAYRTMVMRHGLVHVDPAARSFERDLRQFHREYVKNFPLPAEQETRQGFRELWRASPRDGGYQEVGRSVVCPLTGRYLMGVNFTIQPRSDSVHFIYGFVNPVARGIGGFSALLLEMMRSTARAEITAWLASHPDQQPSFRSPDGPLILFEKNIITAMTLTDILRDTAHIDIDHPPTRRSLLVASAISQSMRDFIWDRRGGRIVDYHYLQPSLDGVVRVPDAARPDVIAYIFGEAPDQVRRRSAAAVLARCLNGRIEGATQLALCVFAADGARAVPAAQVRLSNKIFQGISVVKDPVHLGEDIYFQAQMTSLERHTQDGMVGLKPILPGDGSARDFREAEQMTKALLATLTWELLREGRDRTYADWLRARGPGLSIETS